MAERFHRVRHNAPGLGTGSTEEGQVFRTLLSVDLGARRRASQELLAEMAQQQAQEVLHAVLAPAGGGPRSDLVLVNRRFSRLSGTHLFSFFQTADSVEVGGTNLKVELAPDGRLVSLNADLADPPAVSARPTVSAEAAWRRLIGRFRLDAEAPPAGARLAFLAADEVVEGGAPSWRLVHDFPDVPLPPEVAEAAAARSPSGTYDLYVDAHAGEVVAVRPTARRLAAEIPVSLTGMDAVGRQQTFDGRRTPEGLYSLHDLRRGIEVYDLEYADLRSATKLGTPVRHTSAAFGAINPAAVSAHCNLVRIYDFYNGVLLHPGVDGERAPLVGVVNCTSAASGDAPPEWSNAIWWNGRMWFGQVRGGSDLASLARLLDVAAHEVTHGVIAAVTEFSAINEPAALEESFADIFGLCIANWGDAPPADAQGWSWTIGAGLGPGGTALRDLEDPAAGGFPVHYSQYQTAPFSEHANCVIHTLAAKALLTARSSGSAVLSPKETAELYFLTLSRLTRSARFLDVRETMAAIVALRFPTRPEVADALSRAYDAVGIA
ncbi:MAG: M4 family metallopeptidase [Tistlia sp.]|uniref:M4 family metallopeptidase n=1 Tax=Tistlia sp. TaxID=3057121 RepID=UPI0034A236ED